jgi:hypothetical protein
MKAALLVTPSKKGALQQIGALKTEHHNKLTPHNKISALQ